MRHIHQWWCVLYDQGKECICDLERHLMTIAQEAAAAVGGDPTTPNAAPLSATPDTTTPAQSTDPTTMSDSVDPSQPDGGTEFDISKLVKAQGLFIHAQMRYMSTGNKDTYIKDLSNFVAVQNQILHALGII